MKSMRASDERGASRRSRRRCDGSFGNPFAWVSVAWASSVRRRVGSRRHGRSRLARARSRHRARAARPDEAARLVPRAAARGVAAGSRRSLRWPGSLVRLRLCGGVARGPAAIAFSGTSLRGRSRTDRQRIGSRAVALAPDPLVGERLQEPHSRARGVTSRELAGRARSAGIPRDRRGVVEPGAGSGRPRRCVRTSVRREPPRMQLDDLLAVTVKDGSGDDRTLREIADSARADGAQALALVFVRHFG
jgi:hypothetical protein